MQAKSKCFICDTRPATRGIYCHNCFGHIQAETRKAKESHKAINPERYFTYQGKVICMVNLGGGMGRYMPSSKEPEHLPKLKTVDLNIFCDGFQRDEIKRLKRLVLSLTDENKILGLTMGKSKYKGVKEDDNS